MNAPAEEVFWGILLPAPLGTSRFRAVDLHRGSVAFNNHFAPIKEVALKYVGMVTLVDLARR